MGSSFKKTYVKLDLLTNIDLLVMVEKGIRGGICDAIHWYTKANNKYVKDYDKNKKSSYLNYWDVNNLYGWAISQKLPENNFEWTEETSQFNKDFLKNYNDESDERHFIEIDVQYPLYELHNDYPYLPERKKLKKAKKLVAYL